MNGLLRGVILLVSDVLCDSELFELCGVVQQRRLFIVVKQMQLLGSGVFLTPTNVSSTCWYVVLIVIF